MSALDNLQVISENENKSKIAFYAHPVCQEFAVKAIDYIKPEYQDQVIIE